MNKCKKCRSLFLEHFYGELDTPKKKFFDNHMSVCEKCRSRFSKMEAVLQFTGKRVRPEPPEEFWDSYEKKLTRRIETEEVSDRERESIKEKPGRRFPIAPKWAYQAAAGVALIIIGVFIGRALFSPSIKGVQHASRQPEISTPQQPETILTSRSQDYIERSKLILLALVNFDPSVEDPYALDLPFQKQVSKELVQEASFLKKELAESDQERLENLIASLEVILLQIANLESENDLDAIELVRDGINRRGILMEINLTDLRLSMEREKGSEARQQPKHKPKTI
ncbi:MAG: hypothetical protein JSV17_05350 [Candidatus Aminicenantes bacterium]|nr:MAG: hypothetical protein JSV17_05350 [Candidatus Aminicenantes bacterium]